MSRGLSKARVVDGGAREEYSRHPPRSGCEEAGAWERPLARGHPRARVTSRGPLAFRRHRRSPRGGALWVQRTARCASPQIHTRSSCRNDHCRVFLNLLHGLCGAIFFKVVASSPARAHNGWAAAREKRLFLRARTVFLVDDQSALFDRFHFV